MTASRPRSLCMAPVFSVKREECSLFRFLRGILGGVRRGTRDAPGIVFFLRLRYSFERRLVGLVIHLRLLLIRLLVVAAPIALAAAHLGMRGHCDQRQYRHCYREGLHDPCLPVMSELTLRPDDGNKRSAWRKYYSRFGGRTSAFVDGR